MKSLLPEALQTYVEQTWLREPEILRQLREETTRHPSAGYQIPPDQGQLMQLLVRLMGARRCLEIGVFTGYSSLAVALALPPDGQIIALDINAETTAVARRYWQDAGVADRIDLRLGPALETLEELRQEGKSGWFDFAFIDADKSNYAAYFERTLELVRPGGLILIDNVFWHQHLLNPEDVSADTVAMRALNAQLKMDERIDLAIIPIGDGVTTARKRG